MFGTEQLLNNEDSDCVHHTWELSWVSWPGSSLVPSLPHSDSSTDLPSALQIGLQILEFGMNGVTLCVPFVLLFHSALLFWDEQLGYSQL